MPFNPQTQRKEQDKISLEKRKTSFDEVVIPFDKEDVLEQTNRCLSCPVPKCEEGCPIHLPIRDMIRLIRDGYEDEAFNLINALSPLNGLCAIVCDQASQCEGKCIRGIKDKPVNIGAIHRYVAFLNKKYEHSFMNDNGKNIAVIGAGPSGLSCAYELRKLGYQVTIYDREDDIGGVMYYGIPSFRLNDNDLHHVLDAFKSFGISFELGKEVNIDEIKDKYDALYLAIGTQKSKYMGVPGENLPGVFTSEEFLKGIKVNKNYQKYEQHKKVFVVGGGNVAMDVSRTLVRLCKETTIVYRRSITEAPCRKNELEEANEEGVILSFLTNPVAFIGKEKLEQIKLIKMELGAPDESGRCRPVEIKGSEYCLDADAIVLAIGNDVEKQYLCSLELNRNLLKINNNYQTNDPHIFAGGDVVTGSNTVVHAVKAGIEAAKNIDSYLNH